MVETGFPKPQGKDIFQIDKDNEDKKKAAFHLAPTYVLSASRF